MFYKTEAGSRSLVVYIVLVLSNLYAISSLLSPEIFSSNVFPMFTRIFRLFPLALRTEKENEKSIIQLKHSSVIKFIIWRHSFTTLTPPKLRPLLYPLTHFHLETEKTEKNLSFNCCSMIFSNSHPGTPSAPTYITLLSSFRDFHMLFSKYADGK